MAVARVSRDTPGLDRRDSAEYQRYLRFREGGCLRHVADVAHRGIAADRYVKKSGADPPGENSALDRASARMRDVQDRFVHERLRRQSRRGKKKLPVRMYPAIDSGINRGPAVVETEVRVSSDRVRHENVAGLVRQETARESDCEQPQVGIRVSGRCRLGARKSGEADAEHHDCHTSEDCARKSQICYVLRQMICPEQVTDG